LDLKPLQNIILRVNDNFKDDVTVYQIDVNSILESSQDKIGSLLLSCCKLSYDHCETYFYELCNAYFSCIKCMSCCHSSNILTRPWTGFEG
jgi:hypothetical protein